MITHLFKLKESFTNFRKDLMVIFVSHLYHWCRICLRHRGRTTGRRSTTISVESQARPLGGEIWAAMWQVTMTAVASRKCLITEPQPQPRQHQGKWPSQPWAHRHLGEWSPKALLCLHLKELLMEPWPPITPTGGKGTPLKHRLYLF